MEMLSFLASLTVRSAGLAVLAMAGILILRVRSAAARHAVWSVTAVGMLLLAALSPVLPTVALPVLRAKPESLFVFPDSGAATAADVAQPAAVTGLGAPQGAAWTWQQGVAALYFAGLAIFLARLAFGYLFTVRLVRASTRIDRLGAGDHRESSWISVPLTVGWLRPKLLLPAGWESWEESKLQAVLAHERTHIRRADWAISVVAGVNRCVFWFHPLAWWLERTLASLAEQACDDSALLVVKSEHYAQALLDMAAAVKTGQGRLVWEAMAMAKAAEVRMRIERILDETRQIPQGLSRARWAVLLACSVPLVYLAAVVRPVPASAQEQPKTPAAMTEYLKGKRQFSAADVSVMEQYLAANPHDLDVRSQLVLYYFSSGQRAERMKHIQWLVGNHPESNAAAIASQGISPRPNGLNDAPEYATLAFEWKRQVALHANDVHVLGNAAQFFSQPGGDYQEAERLLLGARAVEPSNLIWAERLGKLYGMAILGTTGDPSFVNSGAEVAARVRPQLETSTDGWLVYNTGYALASVAQRMRAGQPLPAGVLNLDDHPLLMQAVDLGERLRARSAEFGVPAGMARPGQAGPGTIRGLPGMPAPGSPLAELARIDGNALILQANAKADSLPAAPTPVSKIDPVYPPLARQARISGVVKLSIVLGPDGSVQNMEVISGHPLLVPASLEAVRRWTFPAGSAGRYYLPVNFSITDSGVAGGVAGGVPGGVAGGVGSLDNVPRKAGGPQTIRVGANVQAAALTNKVDPVYPPLARQAGIEGTARVQIVIAEDGTVEKVEAVAGHPILLAAVMEAVKQWTYRPTTLNGQAVKVLTEVVIPFELNK